MAIVNIMIHAVWGTKNRVHFLTDDLRLFIINLFRQNAIFLSLSFLLKEPNSVSSRMLLKKSTNP